MKEMTIVDQRGTRVVGIADLPLTIGGPEAHIQLPSCAEALAYLGQAGDEIFVQAAEGMEVSCNGTPLQGSRWLNSGDVLRLGGANVQVGGQRDALSFTVVAAGTTASLPTLVPPSKPADHTATTAPVSEPPESIQPVAFKPNKLVGGREKARGFPIGKLLWLGLFLALAAAAFFLFTARPVTIEIDPSPQSMTVSGGLLTPRIGGRYLLLPGSYALAAQQEGYYPLETPIDVTPDTDRLAFSMQRLPGRLSLSAQEGALVYVDNKLAGPAPLATIELPEGEHAIIVRADRYRDYQVNVNLVAGQTEEVQVELEPLWASVLFQSKPKGAAVRLNGKNVGKTPLSQDVIEGAHRYELALAGYKAHADKFFVKANQPLALPAKALIPSDGNLVVDSEPVGATATINGVYRGETPLDLALKPGQTYEVAVSKAGYVSGKQSIKVKSGQRSDVKLVLKQVMGEVRITCWPPDARLFVDGREHGKAETIIQLQAVPHLIEIRKEGFLSFKKNLTPLPGLAKSLEVTLKTLDQVKKESIKQTYRDGQGHELMLVQPGKFRMGASRREPGRRANETIREVELTRPFYIAKTEVTNSQFNAFRKEHKSGAIGGRSLEGSDSPVVRVTWDDAIEYCNWLSRKEGLAPFYGTNDKPVNAKGKGYRLPSEAEWVWVARYMGKPDISLKYPWGDRLPVAPGSGNYADETAIFLTRIITNYNDKNPVSAKVGSFPANELGVFDLGGNVAEWVHDIYGLRPTPGVQIDPLGPETGPYHVIRGSSWMHSSITELRFSFRDYGDKERPDVGFRVARNLE